MQSSFSTCAVIGKNMRICLVAVLYIKTGSTVEINTINAKQTKKNNERKTISKHLIPTNTYFCFKFHAPIQILQSLGISNEGVLVILRFLTRNLSLTLDESSSTITTVHPSSSVVTKKNM